MNKRIFLVGLAGGIALRFVLEYPLYWYVRFQFIPGGPAVQVRTDLIWLTIAAVFLLVTGFLAGWMSGARSRLGAAGAGAAAGVCAALLAEILIGGAAVGVWSSRLMLAHGIHATRDDAEFLSLLSHAVSSIIWWTYLSIWVATAIGVLLGGLGGLAAGRRGKPADSQPEVWLMLSATGVLASGLNLIVMVAVFGLLGSTLQNVENKIATQLIPGYKLPFPSASILGWPLATNLAWLLFWQLTGWLVLRKLPHSSSCRFLGVILALFLLPFAAGPLVAVILSYSSARFPAPPLSIAAILLAVSIGLLWGAGKISFQPRRLPIHESPIGRFFHKLGDLLARAGQAKIAAWYFLFISLALTGLLALLQRSIFWLPWLSAGLGLGILLAVLGLIETRHTRRETGKQAEPRDGVLAAGTGLGAAFMAGLSLLNSLAPLSLVLIPIVMIAPLMVHDESQVIASAQSQGLTLASVIDFNYLVTPGMAAILGLMVATAAVLTETVGSIWLKFVRRGVAAEAKPVDPEKPAGG